MRLQRQNTTRNTTAEKPFRNASSFVISLGTGITGDETINCHVDKDVDEKIIAQLIGRQFINFKIQRCDNVRSLATMISTVKIKVKVVAIEPMVLYLRMLFVKKDSNDLSEYFKYELTPYPLVLFCKRGMRKIVKSALYEKFSNVY